MTKFKKTFFKKSILLFIISITTLQLGFFSNYWNVAEQGWFDNFQISSQSLIIGRLALSDREGVFFNNGLPGRYYDNENVISFFENGLPDKFNGDEKFYDQSSLYENPGIPAKKESFKFYKSHLAGQGLLYSILSKVSPWTNSENLEIFKFLTALLMSLVIFLFLLWISKNYGFLTSIITLIFLLLSPWLTVFARNLYWAVAVLYIPFITILWLLYIDSTNKRPHFTFRFFFYISFLLVFVKCAFTGFELISTSLLMFVIPFVYYAFHDKWSFKKLFLRVIGTTLGSLTALLLSFSILSYQLSHTLGSFSKGLNYIFYSYFKRTSGGSGTFPERYKESLESTVIEVLEKYWNGTAIDLNSHVSSNWESILHIEYGELFFIFFLFSLAFLVGSKYSISLNKESSKNIPLLITTWISIVAPLSWFIIFKGHSYIHTHTNFIAWYMPFCLYGFAIIAKVLTTILQDGILLYKTIPRKYRVLLQACLIILILASQITSINALQTIKKIKNPVNFYGEKYGFSMYLYNEKIWYIKEKASNKEARFFLHITPSNINDLPENRKKHSFDNLDFHYTEQSTPVPWWKGNFNYLIAAVPLPKYKIEKISTGQYTQEGALWKIHFSGTPLKKDKKLNLLEKATLPKNLYAKENGFRIYIYDHKLWYLKNDASESDKNSKFYLHIIPDNMNDLPEDRKKYQYDNFDFRYVDNQYTGTISQNNNDNLLIAVVELPKYTIEQIKTGQFNEKSEIWRVGFKPK